LRLDTLPVDRQVALAAHLLLQPLVDPTDQVYLRVLPVAVDPGDEHPAAVAIGGRALTGRIFAEQRALFVGQVLDQL
jgi:hypothetical protein